jgi:hypothetical protein
MFFYWHPMLQVFIIGPVLQIRMAEAIIRKMWMEPSVVHDFDRIMNINIFLLYKNDGLPIHLTHQLESNLIAKQIGLQVRCFGAEPKKKYYTFQNNKLFIYNCNTSFEEQILENFYKVLAFLNPKGNRQDPKPVLSAL